MADRGSGGGPLTDGVGLAVGLLPTRSWPVAAALLALAASGAGAAYLP